MLSAHRLEDCQGDGRSHTWSSHTPPLRHSLQGQWHRQVRSKGMGPYIHINTNHNRLRSCINMRQDELGRKDVTYERYHKMTQGPSHQEDVSIINVYSPSDRLSKYISKHQKAETDYYGGEFTPLLSDRTGQTPSTDVRSWAHRPRGPDPRAPWLEAAACVSTTRPRSGAHDTPSQS